jgi:hypothetical protein
MTPARLPMITMLVGTVVATATAMTSFCAVRAAVTRIPLPSFDLLPPCDATNTGSPVSSARSQRPAASQSDLRAGSRRV